MPDFKFISKEENDSSNKKDRQIIDSFLNALIDDIVNSNKKPIDIIKRVLKGNRLARLFFRREGIDNFLPKINQHIQPPQDQITSAELIDAIDNWRESTNLNEISLQQTSSADLEDKKPEKGTGLFKSYDGIDFYKTKNFKEIGDGLLEIFSNGNYVGKLNLGFVKRYKLPEIDQIFLNAEFRGKGYAEKIYAFVLDTFGGIVSGYIQTPGSQKLWVKLAKIYNVYIEDGKGNFYECIIDGNELKAPVKIYGNSNVLLCFKQTPSWVIKKIKNKGKTAFIERIIKESKNIKKNIK